MGRFGRALAASGLFLCLVPPAILARDTAGADRLPIINGTVNSSQWEELPYDQTLQRCTSVDCAALKSIVRSFDYFYKLYLSGTIEPGHPPPPLPKGPAPLVRDVTLHPELKKPACKLLAVIARNYFDWSVGLLTVELASLISTGHRQCVERVVIALPKNKETRELIENAREMCVTRHEPNCPAIALNRQARTKDQ